MTEANYPLPVIEALLTSYWEDSDNSEAWVAWGESTMPRAVPYLGTVAVEEKVDTRDGWGDAARTLILRVTPANGIQAKFYRKNGSYDSYGSETYDGSFEEIEPEKVTVTKWKVVS